MNKKTLSLLLFLMLAITFVAGCSSDQEEASTENIEVETESSDEETVSGEPKYGGELVIVDLSDGLSLDPHKVTDAASMRYIENMYNTLFRYKDGTYGELEGDLAKEYTVSDDGLVYTFVLHEGVKFHNGDVLTSADVKYSIERIIELEVRAPQFAAINKIDTPDDQTVVFTLNEPVAPLLTFLAYPVNAIVNQTIVEENEGSLDQVDAGSGPFQLVEWKRDQHLKLEKFDNYFVAGKPYLDQVTFRSIPDETSRLTAIRNQEIDILLQVAPKDVELLEKATGVNVKSVAGTYWEYLGMNVEAGPLAEQKVRQAIAHAIDRDAINNFVKFGQAAVLKGGPIPEGHWAHYEGSVYPQRDLEKAKQLLEDAGYGDGFPVTLKVSPNENQVNAAQVIKQQLAEVGINVNVLSQERSVFFEALGKKDFEMTVVGWVGFVDPDEFLYNLFGTGRVWNQQAYSNPEVDELLQKGRTVMDQEERKAIYDQAQQIIAEESPIAVLYANPQTSALVDGVYGFDVNPTVSTISLQNTWLDK
jgi:peptide/nickel transport system substrate-binding protein